MVRTILLSLSIVSLTSSAAAANWASGCSPSSDGGSWYVDASSLRLDRGQPVARIRLVPSERAGDTREERVLVRFDCLGWKMSITQWSRHDHRGAILGSGRLPDTLDNYRDIRPESFFDETATILCSQSNWSPTAGIAADANAIAVQTSGPRRARMSIDQAVRRLGGRITSGKRSSAAQRALYEAGFTRVLNSAHVRGHARDIIGLSRQQIFTAAQLAHVQVHSLVWETGLGRHQGTGAHWHLEFGPGAAASASRGAQLLRWRTCRGTVAGRYSH